MDRGDLNLWTELTAEQYAELRDDIAAHGIRQPISVMADGVTVIDGHNRRAIAAELGIDCPVIVWSNITTIDQAIELSVRNSRHRRLKGDRLTDAVTALRRQGWANPRIAADLDIGVETVRQHGRKSKSPGSPNGDPGDFVPEQVAGSDTKEYPVKKANKAEAERRRDVAAALARDGYNRNTIAKAIGVSHGTVDSDLAARQVHTRGRSRVDAVPPERAYWRDSDPVAKQPGKKKNKPIEPLPPRPDELDVASWRRFDPLQWVEHFVVDFADSDLTNVLACRIFDALEGGDPAWVEEQRELLLRAHDMVSRLVAVVNDPDYRELCRSTVEGRERLRDPTVRKWAAK